MTTTTDLEGKRIVICPECGAEMERHMPHPSWPGERVEREPHYWCGGSMTSHIKPITVYDDGTKEDF